MQTSPASGRGRPPSRRASSPSKRSLQSSDVTPFTNVAPDSKVLRQGYQVWNDRPGVAVFDYDRDGDLDFYVTSETGHANWLYRNDGDGSFTNVAAQAGVDATGSNSTGVAACDIDNDGFQDLYVGAWGVLFDRPRLPLAGGGRAQQGPPLPQRRQRKPSGTSPTPPSETTPTCARRPASHAPTWTATAGSTSTWANLLDNDFRIMDRPDHPGHYNALYRNNGDLTFTEILAAGRRPRPPGPDAHPRRRAHPLRGPAHRRALRGLRTPSVTDKLGNRVGDPTGQTHAVLFFDYDDDGDPDLWVANDGDRLHLYRNDSTPGSCPLHPGRRRLWA